MTGAAPVTPRRRAPKPPRAHRTAVVCLVVFAGVLAFLAWQMSAGHDPALGAGTPAPVRPAPRRVFVKRIERTVIVTTVKPAGTGGTGGSSVSSSSSVSGGGAPPVAYAPAPATGSSGG